MLAARISRREDENEKSPLLSDGNRSVTDEKGCAHNLAGRPSRVMDRPRRRLFLQRREVYIGTSVLNPRAN